MLPIEILWPIFDHLTADDLVRCIRVSREMYSAIMEYRPGKTLDLSLMPTHTRKRLTLGTLRGRNLKEIMKNHGSVDVTGILLTTKDVEALFLLGLDRVIVARCAAIKDVAILNGFINTVCKRPRVTTDLYMAGAGHPLKFSFDNRLLKCHDRARVVIHSCNGVDIDCTFLPPRISGDIVVYTCHCCGIDAGLESCSKCRLSTCNGCKTSKCSKCEDEMHGKYCQGCLDKVDCSLCGQYYCYSDDTVTTRVSSCVVCGLRSCSDCTPSIHSCSKCRNRYCGTCYTPAVDRRCSWRCV